MNFLYSIHKILIFDLTNPPHLSHPLKSVLDGLSSLCLRANIRIRVLTFCLFLYLYFNYLKNWEVSNVFHLLILSHRCLPQLGWASPSQELSMSLLLRVVQIGPSTWMLPTSSWGWISTQHSWNSNLSIPIWDAGDTSGILTIEPTACPWNQFLWHTYVHTPTFPVRFWSVFQSE